MFTLNLSPGTQRRSRRLQRVLTDASRAGAVEKLEDRALLADFPELHSLPDAPVSLFLDFDGHIESDPFWTSRNNGNDVVTPPYNSDGNAAELSDTEALEIEAIWRETAEDFAPFDVNVTTVDPGSYNNFETMVIVVGGDGSWFGNAGGVAPINAFSNSAPNVGFTFSEVQRDIFTIAITNSHEAGHGFGLQHHSLYDENGTKQQEYHPGFDEWGPIMGAPFRVTRGIWYDGLDTNGVPQLDMDRLTRSANRTFKFRAQEHGSSTSTATSPDFDDNGVFSVDGVIGRPGESDWFKIETDTGEIEFDVEVLNHQGSIGQDNFGNPIPRTPGTNLDVVLRLLDSSGGELETSAPDNSYDAALSYEATEGTYFVEVTVEDLYGNTGSYTLNGDIIPLPTTPTMLAPVGFVGAKPPHLWTQTASTQSYELQVDNVTTGEQDVIRVDGLTSTSFTPVFSLNDDHTYRARVRSLSLSNRLSPWSEYTTYTVEVPGAGVSTMISPRGRIDDPVPTFTWTEAENAETYTLRVTNNVTNEIVIFRTGIRDLEYTHFTALPDGEYKSEVQAVNEAGEPGVYSQPLDFTLEVARAEIPQIVTPLGPKTSSRRFLTRWTAAINAVSYDFQMQNLSTGKKNFIRKTNLANTSFKPNRKLDQGAYLLRVRARDVLGRTTEWSDEVTITVDVPTPAVPDWVVPTEGETLATQFPTFEWEKGRRAKKYRLIVLDQNRDDLELVRKTINGGNVLQWQSNTKLPESDNLIALIASINSVGELSEYAQVEFGIEVAKPSRPVFTAPSVNVNGTIDDNRPRFKWTAATNAVSYDLFVKLRGSGRTVLKARNIKDTSYRFDERLDEGKQYEVTVVAKNSAGEKGKTSPALRFVVDVPEPDTPVMYGPQGDITARRPTLDWENVAFADKFQLFVKNLDTNSTERYTLRDWDVSGDGEIASYRLPDKLRKGTYQAWVRAVNVTTEKSGYSNQVTFSIVSSDSVPDAEMPQDMPMPEPETPAAEQQATQEIHLVTPDTVPVEQPVLTTDEQQTPVTPEETASAKAMAEFIDNDWWTPNLESEVESESSAPIADGKTEISTAEVAITAAALPIFAGKLLKKVRRKKKQNKK